MILPRLSVNNPVTTLMFFLGITVLGITALWRLPVELFPKIDPPVITVFTNYSGSSAADVEQNITKPLEDALGTIEGLKYETNLDESSNSIRDAVDRIKRFLPDEIDAPIILKFNTGFFPIVVMTATAKESYPSLHKILEEHIVNPLNRIPGVGAVILFGGPVRQIRVDIDPQKLEAHNITVEQIRLALAAENINLPGGNLKIGKLDYTLRIMGEFTHPSQVEQVSVGQQGGQIIYLRDVATVYDGLKERTIEEYLNGQHGLRLVVQKQSDANTVNVARTVNKKIEELATKLPSDVQLHSVFDTSEFILNSVSNLGEALYYGGLFVILVVLFFLGRWRSAFIISLAIPFSLIIAFIYLFFSGNSLNIISLSSLSIAMGMVVDDAIVILENVMRHIDRGSRPREAAVYGSAEVSLAVMAGTLTIIAVFFPLVFLTGLSGIMFRQLGVIVTITITASVLVSLTLTPMLASKLFKQQNTSTTSLKSRWFVSRIPEIVLDGMDNMYRNILRWSLHHKKIVLVTALLIFILSAGLIKFIGTEFLPESDNASLQAKFELQTGTRLEESVKLGKKLEEIIKNDFPEIKVNAISAGVEDVGFNFAGRGQGTHVVNLMARLTPKSQRERSVFEIADEMRKKIKEIPGIVKSNIITGGMVGSGMLFGSGGKPFEMVIYGNSFEATDKIAAELAGRLSAIKGARDVEISRSAQRPELRVHLNKEKMAMTGLNTYTVANAIRNRIAGTIATRYREEGDEYDIFIRNKPEYRASISDIESIAVPSLTGQKVRVGDIAVIDESYAPIEIERRNKERIVRITASLHEISLGEVTAEMQDELRKMDIPDGIDIEFGGQVEQQKEAFGDLLLLLFISIMLVYIVMASQFESFLDPFIIMLSVPFAFTGVMIGLFFGGISLSVISFLGGIMLVGIVVKNAIVLVDFTNLMRERGMELNEAIVYSGGHRLRPVLMTSLTTILSMVPLIINTGEGSEIWRPMAVALVSGLTTSTLITLVIVPVIYAVFNRRRKITKKLE
ncbi:MAG: efflux RND transporter permease subunit [Bacteroidetes bacterium]|nr:efflux RND transporter permease subunit [Bacteroidota bacterium]